MRECENARMRECENARINVVKDLNTKKELDLGIKIKRVIAFIFMIPLFSNLVRGDLFVDIEILFSVLVP